MDNQQIRLAALKGWLAGMIDADGCIGFLTRHRRGYTMHAPYVDIASISPDTIEVLVKAIKTIDCACWVSKANSRGLQGVRCLGIKRISKLLNQIQPFMATKQKEAHLILQWCDSRLTRVNKPYNDLEDNLYAEIKRQKTARNLRGHMLPPCWIAAG